MNWIEVAWVMMIAASLMLGVIHLVVWLKQRSQYAGLLFFALATSVAAYGAFELAIMRAQTPTELAAIARWAHVPLAMVVLSIVGFVRAYFGAGRLWLAYAVVGIRVAALALNFLTGANVNFQEITAVDHLLLWGGAVVSGPVGVANPWAIVPQLSNVLLVAFVVDASITLWRRGGAVARRRAALVGGSLVLCIVAAASFAALIVTGVVHAPTILMPGFFIVVLAMDYELIWDLIAAAQLAAQIRAGERRFRAVFEASPSATLVVDEDGTVRLANARAETVFGYACEELVGRAVETLIPARLRMSHEKLRQAYTLEARERMMGTGRELFALRKDGGEIPVEVALSPMRAEQRLSILVSVVDITERRRAERAEARHRDEIAHLSRVATLGELSGSVAHEINQPLMGILSNAQAAQRFLARDDVNLDEVREILVDIVEDDKRAGEIIRRLRALLKKGKVEQRPLDISAVVDDVLRLTRNELMTRDVAVSTELTPDLPPVFGDRIQLQQVLLNLVMNACEAMETAPGTNQVHIRTRRTDDGAGAEISVSDRGGGIPDGDLERVFEPFVTTKEHGIGLGLSICRTIIIAHGGRLWAENTGEGAMFRFTLPLTNHAK